jgi:hypothetical protein
MILKVVRLIWNTNAALSRSIVKGHVRPVNGSGKPAFGMKFNLPEI